MSNFSLPENEKRSLTNNESYDFESYMNNTRMLAFLEETN